LIISIICAKRVIPCGHGACSPCAKDILIGFKRDIKCDVIGAVHAPAIRTCELCQQHHAEICAITRTDGDALRDIGYIALIANATQKAADLMAKAKPSGTADWQAFLEARRAGSDKGGADGQQNDAVAALLNIDYEKAVAEGKVISAQTRFQKRGNMSWRGIGLGGIAVAASLLAAIIGPDIATHMQADHVTSTGEMRTITLSDNSTVTLAPESAITVHFDGTTLCRIARWGGVL